MEGFGDLWAAEYGASFTVRGWLCLTRSLSIDGSCLDREGSPGIWTNAIMLVPSTKSIREEEPVKVPLESVSQM